MSDTVKAGPVKAAGDGDQATGLLYRGQGLDAAIRPADVSVQRLMVVLVSDVAARSDAPDDLRRRARNLLDHLPAGAAG
jgi:hypothetical protein